MKVKFNKKPLENLVGQLTASGKDSRVQVGVLAGKPRIDTELTNAEIGAVHEYGSPSNNIPQRSFLLMPMQHYLVLGMNVDWIATIRQKGMIGALKKLGVIAEGIIQEGFASGGFGFWKPLQPATIARKGSSAILIDTSQLRRSISSRVV